MANGWVPTEIRCDTACHQAIGTVFETLVVLDENDEPVPFLLESMTPNDDFTVWTAVTREGIEFHDGTPFDAAAVTDTFERALAGALSGRVLENITEVNQLDDRTVEVTMAESWAAFPAYLTVAAAYVASPTWLAAVDAGEAEPDEPVGTGPFVFDEYEPNVTFRVTRNDAYWLSDADGNAYPYLDEIEFLVQEDDAGRERALLIAGDVDMTHTDKGLDDRRPAR